MVEWKWKIMWNVRDVSFQYLCLIILSAKCKIHRLDKCLIKYFTAHSGCLGVCLNNEKCRSTFITRRWWQEIALCQKVLLIHCIDQYRMEVYSVTKRYSYIKTGWFRNIGAVSYVGFATGGWGLFRVLVKPGLVWSLWALSAEGRIWEPGAGMGRSWYPRWDASGASADAASALCPRPRMPSLKMLRQKEKKNLLVAQKQLSFKKKRWLHIT